MHCSLPFRKRFNHTISYIQVINKHCGAHNIGNGINCADFMKMHLFHRAAVGFGLSFGNNTESLFRQLPRPRTQIPPLDNFQNIRQIAVNVFVMIAVMLVVFVVFFVMVMMLVFVIVVVMFFAVVVVMLVFVIVVVMFFAVVMMMLIVAMHIERRPGNAV